VHFTRASSRQVRLRAVWLDPNSSFNLDASDPRRQEARYYFDLHDWNASGEMDAEELPALLRSLGVPAWRPRQQQLLAQMDSRGNGSVGRDEFVDWFAARGWTWRVVWRPRSSLGAGGGSLVLGPAALALRKLQQRTTPGGRATVDAQLRLAAKARYVYT
jgi:hypothetical protein